jgi:subtilisin family serine protease
MRLTHRVTRRVAAVVALPLLLSPLVAQAGTTAPPAVDVAADRLDPWLTGHLAKVADTTTLRVAVRGTSYNAALSAARNAGMAVQQKWPLVNAVVAVGPAKAVPVLARQTGIVYVEGDRPLNLNLATAHKATRSDVARATFRTPSRGLIDGSGITIAIVDSGVDSLHPMFQQNGKTKVVQNRKNACVALLLPALDAANETCFAPSPDTDTISAGGHGTHVAGIAAGVPVTTSTGAKLRGSAPGAKLVMLSVGAVIAVVDAMSAQYWILEHQRNPCRTAAQQSMPIDPACPPIRVTNHSYGPDSGSEPQRHNPRALDVVLQQQLVRKGVVAVWAANNNGGRGAEARTNPTAMDPTGGVIMVANYNDGNTGERDRGLASGSSRGKIGVTDSYPDLSAPGTDITASCRAYLAICNSFELDDLGNYGTISGTSMASPYVAGVVAMMMQADPRLTPAKIEILLERYAFRFGEDYERDPLNSSSPTSFDKGHGLVDVFATLKAVCATKGARC